MSFVNEHIPVGVNPSGPVGRNPSKAQSNISLNSFALSPFASEKDFPQRSPANYRLQVCSKVGASVKTSDCSEYQVINVLFLYHLSLTLEKCGKTLFTKIERYFVGLICNQHIKQNTMSDNLMFDADAQKQNIEINVDVVTVSITSMIWKMASL